MPNGLAVLLFLVTLVLAVAAVVVSLSYSSEITRGAAAGANRQADSAHMNT